MTDTQYTKGPWEAHYNDHYWSVYIPWERGGKIGRYCQSVADVPNLSDSHAPEWLRKEGGFNEEANARLIAAAPELLEALKTAREYFDARADAESFPDSAGCHPNEEMVMLIAIDAAITKAKGDS